MKLTLQLLLRCLPRAFRDAYARDILELFEARYRRGRSAWSRLALLLGTAIDILCTAAAEWRDVLRAARRRQRDEGRLTMSDRLTLDVKDALRRLASAPGFTVAALLMLAAGIGGSSVIFTVVDALVLRDLPFARPGELVFVYQDSDEGRPSSNAYPAYLDVKAHTDLFSEVGAVMPEGSATLLRESEEPRAVQVEFATSSYLPALGLRPALGRWFFPEEDHTGAEPMAVLSYSAWRRRFGGDPAVLGQRIRLSGAMVTIVGVGPADYNGFLPGVASEAWLSISALGPVGGVFRGRTLTRREDHWFQIAARLAPGRTAGEAQAAMNVLADRLAREFPGIDRGRRITVMAAGQVRVHPDIDVALYPVAAAPLVLIALVLTLVCSNLANLTLARGTARRRELAVRLAIGATRAQVVRAMTLESLLLSAAGGLAGVLMAWWAIRLLSSWQAPVIEATPALALDARVLGFAAAISGLTAVAFGLLPALRTTRGDLRPALAVDTGRAVRVRDIRGLLIAVQIAICIVVLAGGGVLLRSMLYALRLDPGFDADTLAMAGIDAGQGGRPAAQAPQLLLDLRERVSMMPGVRKAALTTRAPVTRFGASTSLVLDEHARPGADGTRAAEIRFAAVTPGYFETLGIPLLHGRDFTADDRADGASVAIVSRAMAVRYWGTADAIGRRYRHQGAQTWVTIVGVVGDVPIETLGEPPGAFVYRPFAQRTPAYAALLVRTAGPPAAVLPLVRQELRALDAKVPMLQSSTMSEYMGRSLALPRAVATVLGCAAALALLLACLGVYSVVAFTVARRRTEMGVRMALGATARQVTGLVLREMLWLVGVGVAVGTTAAAFATQVLGGLLVGISPLDPSTFAGVAALVGGAALLTTWIPARRAALADPARELRAD